MLVSMLAYKHAPYYPKDVSIAALVEQNNDQLDVNFINRNNFNNNTYRNNFANNCARLYPQNSYMNSYGNKKISSDW